MAIYSNGQVGWHSGVVTPSTPAIWTNIYAVYNADSVGSSSLKTSLVSVYNGESNANDSFGANNGTAQGGLTYTTGKIGNAFSFNGTNAYVSLPNNSFNNLTGDFSVSFWMNSNNSHSTDGGMLFSNMQFPVGVSTYYGFQIGFYNGQIYFTVGNDTGYSTASTRLVSNTLSGYIGTWVYVTCTHKQSTGYKIYVNGVLNNSNNGTYNPVYTTNHTPTIGAQYSVNASPNLVYPFNGKLDAVNIWNKELTQSEITELYNLGNGAQYITDNFYKPTTNDALNTYNGTAQGGLTYGVGKVGTAFQFNGTNAYVQLGDVMDVGTSSWSYSCWFNASQLTAGNYYTLFSKSLQDNGIGRIWGIMNGNKLEFSFATAALYPSVIITQSTSTFNINTWYHVVFVLDRTDKLKMYINGSLENVNTIQGDIPNNLTPFSSVNYNNNQPFRIGTYTATNNTTPSALFNGSIDAFNVWNKVLTQSEITELYNSGNGKQYPN